jgi:hypothetical protein
MRKSFDRLSGLIARHLGALSVTDGALFVFINRQRDRMGIASVSRRILGRCAERPRRSRIRS